MPPGARALAYIVFSDESGPSDQIDINRTVSLDPLGRWSVIRETGPVWTLKVGGRPVPEPSRLPVRSHGFWSLLDDRKLRGTLISLCKPNVWAFLPYFVITPAEIDKHQNSWNSVR